MTDVNSGTPSASPQRPEDLVGAVLADRYAVKRLLGHGGMGSVYLAEHVTLRKRVAVKVLHHELCRDQTQVERFLQEARAASMIGHEHIVDIVDFGPVPGGSVFFAMEYLEGEDLAQLMRRERRLEWSRARGIILQIIRGLGAAHRKGIIHRDLKPANCFLVRRSDRHDFIKLLDFGIAKVNDPDAADASGLTRTGSVFGTAKYMSPEQACGEPADERTDIYAVAVCLYEFMTGRVPFEGGNFMQVLSRHLTEQLPLPREVAPDARISLHVEALIVKALAKRPRDRYADMVEFEAAVLAIGRDGYPAPITEPALADDSDGDEPPTLIFEGEPSHPRPGRGRTLMGDSRRASPSRPEPAIAARAVSSSSSVAPHARPTHRPTAPAVAPRGVGVPGGPTAAQSDPLWPESAPSTTPPAPETRPPSYSPFDRTSESTSTGPPSSRLYTAALLLGCALLAIGAVSVAALTMRERPRDRNMAIVDRRAHEMTLAPRPLPERPPSPTISAARTVEAPDAAGDPTRPVAQPTPSEPQSDRPEPAAKPPAKRASPTKAASESRARPPSKPKPKPKPKPKLSDELSSAQIGQGFAKARQSAVACEGWLPGMKIEIEATINKDGQVIRAKPLTQTALPVAKCVAASVRRNARFAATTKPLDVETWIYSL